MHTIVPRPAPPLGQQGRGRRLLIAKGEEMKDARAVSEGTARTALYLASSLYLLRPSDPDRARSQPRAGKHRRAVLRYTRVGSGPRQCAKATGAVRVAGRTL